MQRPNILWICTDQQRYDTVRALGNRHIHTPNLDRLVRQGVAFTRAYCQSPICTPSRGSFLTGMYPSSVHACMNGNERWAEAAPLVTKLIADAGYDCGLVGKLHLSGAAGRVEPRPKDDGYRVFEWSHEPRDMWPEGDAYRDWLAERGVDLSELVIKPGEIPPELHQTAWCADRAIEFMRVERDKPWFMSVNIFDPHAPFNPPLEYLHRYLNAELPDPLYRPADLEAQRRLSDIDFQNPARDPTTFDARSTVAAYYAMIELIDFNVGRMLDALHECGQDRNTIVIFMSDHGEMLGDHGLLLKGCRFYEGLVRVPLIISWPEEFQRDVLLDSLVELTDIAPTLLDVCGVETPPRMQGKSLLPLLRNGGGMEPHRSFVRCEYYHTLNPDAAGRESWEGSYATMIRDRRFKLVTYHGHDYGELFDLDADAGEFDNRWDDPALAEVRFRLMKQSFDALAFAADLGPDQEYAF